MAPTTTAPAGASGRKGLVVAGLSVAALVVVGFFVWLFGFALAGSSGKPAQTAAPTTAAPTTTVPVNAGGGQGRSSEAAFGSVPGYTLKVAPASVLAEVKRGFDRGVKSAFNGAPGLTVDPEKVIVGISGRTIVRDNKEVGLAIAISFDDRWASQIPADEFSPLVGRTLGTIEEGTLGDQTTVFVDTGDTADLLAYRDGTFLIVVADTGDRATLDNVMAGLLKNLG